MSSQCAGCKQKLPKREYLTCAYCDNQYDLECANVSIARFNNTMTEAHKHSWKCPDCQCKTPKTGNNDNTPVCEAKKPSKVHQVLQCQTQTNVTQRKKNPSIRQDETTSLEDLSIIEDTAYLQNLDSTQRNISTEITVQMLSDVIVQKLQENNTSIIAQIQNTIQTEVHKAVNELKNELRNEFKKDTEYLKTENKNRKIEIDQLQGKIETLTQECILLKNEMSKLEVKIVPTGEYTSENNCKKFVLYGLAEYYKEPEHSLHDRIHRVFQDLLHVNLTGYIEETRRIGRYNGNGNRPLVVELISKRMVKYILDNNHYFQGTGLSVSDYLDNNKRKERKLMREEMMLARQRGSHAIIRNNELFIDGEKINLEHRLHTNLNAKESTSATLKIRTEKEGIDQKKHQHKNNNDDNLPSQIYSNSSFRKYQSTSSNYLSEYAERLQ